MGIQITMMMTSHNTIQNKGTEKENIKLEYQ